MKSKSFCLEPTGEGRFCSDVPGHTGAHSCPGAVWGNNDTTIEPDQTLKKDAGKVPLELISDLAELELAKVLAFGAKKYSRDGWRVGMEWRRLIGAARRHLSAFSRGEDRDEETGLPHLAHLMCCAMFLLEYQITGNGTDDRWLPKKK